MQATDFILAMYNCSDIEYSYQGKRYMLEMWRNEDGLYSARIDSIEKDSVNLFFAADLSLSECVQQFEETRLFDGRTVYEAEKDIEILFG